MIWPKVKRTKQTLVEQILHRKTNDWTTRTPLIQWGRGEFRKDNAFSAPLVAFVLTVWYRYVIICFSSNDDVILL